MAVLSVLDLSPVPEGSTVSQSLRNTLDLARHAERLGYNRYWLAEHHNMPGIASAATSVVIGHVAAGTSTIRVGAGGIMLPNHAPLVIAEQFGTLAALHPGRIDLGLGRAPGTDMLTARALRRNLEAGADSFPQDVIELMNYFHPAEPGQRVRAVPGEGEDVRDLGARVEHLRRAARRHARPALRLRLAFRAGRDGAGDRDLPLALPALGTAGEAEAHARAQRLRRRHRRRGAAAVQLAAAGLRQSAHRPAGQAACRRSRITRRRSTRWRSACSTRRCPAPSSARRQTVRSGLDAFVRRTGADELMVTAQIFDHEARLRSFEILADAHRELSQAA